MVVVVPDGTVEVFVVVWPGTVVVLPGAVDVFVVVVVPESTVEVLVVVWPGTVDVFTVVAPNTVEVFVVVCPGTVEVSVFVPGLSQYVREEMVVRVVCSG